RTAVRESPRETPSGTWCRTESCATSPSASCIAASEREGARVNDGYDAGYGGGAPDELVGYDAYGQPVCRQVPVQQAPQQPPAPDPYGSYDPYQQQTGVPQPPHPQQDPHGSGYDPYATGAGQPAPAHSPADPHRPPPPPPAPAPAGPCDPHAQGGTGRQRGVTEQRARLPQPARPVDDEDAPAPDGDGPEYRGEAEDGGGPEYRTEQFAFVEEPDGDSEDVIDWLTFTENRTE